MKLYVEVTHTEQSDMNTGIPRVVRNVLRNLLELGPAEGITVLPVVFRRGSFVIVSPEMVLKNKARQHRAGDNDRRIIGWTKDLVNGLSARCGRVPKFVRARVGRSVAKLINSEANQKHVLLLLDASWAYDIWPAIESLKMGGLRVISVIYDLIPMTHAHTVVESLVRAFDRWLHGQMRFADSVVCISNSMADVVRGYFQERLSSVGSPLFLMIGTIEPRKNHRHVFEAFRRVWAKGIDARLAIVGARDWKTEELLAEIAEHPEAERRLFLIRDASDVDVKWLYENATALIMASEVEGFGLPIVEARQMGLSVICSDIPVFAELAAEGTEFFRLGDVDDLARVIMTHLALGRTGSRAGKGWITWRESSQQLLGAIRAVAYSNDDG